MATEPIPDWWAQLAASAQAAATKAQNAAASTSSTTLLATVGITVVGAS